MTLQDIRVNYQLLLALGNKRLPVRLGYAISRNLDKLKAEYERSETERTKLCEQYADKDADGKPILSKSVINGEQVTGYQIPDDKRDEFAAQLTELYDTDVPLDLMTVDESVLDLLDSDRYDALTPAELYGIDWMIKR